MIGVGLLVGSMAAVAAPDPPITSNNAAYFQGNQSQGVSFSSGTITILNVNSLSTAITPSAGTEGILFSSSAGGNVTLNSGTSATNVVIHTSGAAGIDLQSAGIAPYPQVNPVLGIPIPGDNVPGGVVQVNSYSDITTTNDNAPGIRALSQTTGYPQAVIDDLNKFNPSNITYAVSSVDGSAGDIGQAVSAVVIDSNGLPVAGNGGTFTISGSGTYSYNPGTAFTNLADGASETVRMQYDVVLSSSGGSITATAYLLVTATMSNSNLTYLTNVYFPEFGVQQIATNSNIVLPDLQGYVDNLKADAAAGGAGNSVTITSAGSISTSGASSPGVHAESQGADGGTGHSGSIGHSAGSGGLGSRGGDVDVTADGYISTTYRSTNATEASAGIVAHSQGGNGGQGGDGGSGGVRWGASGGTGGNGGDVTVNGSATIHTVGDYGSGIIAFSEGGNGGGGGAGHGAMPGGNGGYGGMGGAVTVDGSFDITTEGDKAHAIWAKSLGGNAGSGGNAGWLSSSPGSGGQATDGGTVTVVSDGALQTLGDDSYGIYAQSVGGFGGNGGTAGGLFWSFGGDGNSAGSGGYVTVTNGSSGSIITSGDRSHGIFAQSVGGGGGSGGGEFALIASLGGQGGAGGNGGTVSVVNSGTIVTFGAFSYGIYAQSIGGGGGDGGDSSGLVAIGGAGAGSSPGGAVSVVNQGLIETTNTSSDAIFAQSIGGGGGSAGQSAGVVSIGGAGQSGGSGGTVTVTNTGQIVTLGSGSRGIVAQSIGGGGGDGGDSGGLLAIGGGGSGTSPGGAVTVVNTGSISSSAEAIFAESVGGGGGNGGSTAGWFSFGGSGGGGGNGSTVTVSNSGSLATTENNASAIFAQSVGGGGGNGGNSIAVGAFGSLGIGGTGGVGGAGGYVVVTSTTGTIVTAGNNAYGIMAESVGGGGGNGGFAFAGSIGTVGSVAIGIGGGGGGGGAASDVVVESGNAITTYGTNAHAIFAQSVGGGGGAGGFSIAVSGSEGPSLSLSIGGKGGTGGSARDVSVTSSGTLQTYGDRSYGILAQSVGGGGGDGGFSVSAAATLGDFAAPLSFGGSGGVAGSAGNVYVDSSSDITTVGNDAHAIMAQSVGGGGGAGGFSIAGSVSVGTGLGLSFGGAGGAGSSGSNVTVVSTGNIVTLGDRSDGILAQSIGGGGGNGGFSIAGGISGGPSANLSMGGDGGAGANGGAVEVDSTSSITTTGSDSHAIMAQSVGGGGGAGGFSVAGSVSADSGAISASIGGSGGGGSTGGTVTVTSTGAITTLGDRSYGILAQSIGGSGGDGGFSVAGSISKGPSVSLTIGGGGGKGGAGGTVTVDSGSSVSTSGTCAHAIFAQSVGGGGGAGGFSVAGSVSADSGAISASIGGSGGAGGNAGVVSVTSTGAMIGTMGEHSFGILAQSIGGGGGDGGFSVAGSISKGPEGDLSIGGRGGAAGNGGAVSVFNSSSISTVGSNSLGIFAQSVGGGGGDGGFSVAGGVSVDSIPIGVSIGGSVTNGGSGGTVTITNTAAMIHTRGQDSDGILAQSVGGGGGDGGFSVAGGFSKKASVDFSLGGRGGAGGDGRVVNVLNAGDIYTEGDSSHGIFAQSVGGGGGKGGFSAAGSVSEGDESKQISIAIGGDGGSGGTASVVTVSNSGSITTLGDWSHGIFAQSVGGGGGDGGDAKALNTSLSALSTSITGNVVQPQSSEPESGGSKSWSLSVAIGAGGNGGSGGIGAKVSVDNSGDISTVGDNSRGIFAQSVGGGGGAGGSSITDTGGDGSTNLAINLGFSLGGKGGAGGAADVVTVTNSGTIVTEGEAAHGIFAQSVGGGGGAGGASAATAGTPGTNTAKSITVTASLGGDGGIAGNGSNVFVVNQGVIQTFGEGADGILAQSVGGGGGDGGTAKAEIKAAESAASNEVVKASISPASTVSSNESESSSWSVTVAVGAGGHGGSAGAGGQVTVQNSGEIYTSGANARGIFAQSVGGGGGAGGASTSDNGGGSGDISVNLGFSLGGKGGAGGAADVVSVINSGSITTLGDGAHGIVAQSVGGGGGVGGASVTDRAPASDDNTTINLNATIGGSGGVAGNGGRVWVSNLGSIDTSGGDAYGILAQSVGGGGGDGGNATIGTEEGDTNSASGESLPSISPSSTETNSSGTETNENKRTWSVDIGFGLGGSGGAAGNGGDVTVTNAGIITTRGTNSIGIFAQSVGGGGGAGGATALEGSNSGGNTGLAINIGIGLGGSGTCGGNGGVVVVNSQGTITTAGDSAHAIFAQSVGGGGGAGGESASSAGSNSNSKVSVTVVLGGNGAVAGNGSNVVVVNSGHLETLGATAYGILAQSIGGGGGIGGASTDSGNGSTNTIVNIGVNVGGAGGAGGTGGAVTVTNSGGIVTVGNDSHGIFAQSVGGGGGNAGGTTSPVGGDSTVAINIGVGGGGGNGNNGGAVVVYNNGDIDTYGDRAFGILAQSIGGGGGLGGNAMIETNSSGDHKWALDVAVGGGGAGASDGGNVTVENVGTLVTRGVDAHGIFAQSVGGGGGDGGYGGHADSQIGSVATNADLQITVGGSAGSGGKGGDVNVSNSGEIVTVGDNSFGVLAQSVGGGGGIGGEGQSGSLAKLAIGGAGGAGGDGGSVTVTVTGTIETFGAASYGVFAQSVGGGGGIAGNVNNGVNTYGLAVNIGQSGGAGGNGGDVTVISAGDIITHGNGADGIFAQSVGGGGGLAGDLGNGLSFAGSVGASGSAGRVTITHTGDIVTYGNNADGIFAQSAGGVGVGAPVTINYIGSISVFGSNSYAVFVQSRGDQGADNMSLTFRDGVIQGTTAAVRFADGADNTVQNFSTIAAANGVAGTAIVGADGNETINNYGTIIGAVDLGAGQNAFNNSGLFESGSAINLGAGNLLLNAGTLAVGGPGTYETTVLTGDFQQTAFGTLAVKLNPQSGDDQLVVEGTGTLDGGLSVYRGPGLYLNGETFDVLVASNGLAGTLNHTNLPASTPVLGFQLNQLSNDLQVQANVSFSGFAKNSLQRGMGRYFDRVAPSASGELAEALGEIETLSGRDLNSAYSSMSPGVYQADTLATFSAIRGYMRSLQERMLVLRPDLTTLAASSRAQSERAPVLLAYNGPVSDLGPLQSQAPSNEISKACGWWMEGLGQWGQQQGSDGYSGFDYQTAGPSFGFDCAPVDPLLVGADFGYTTTHLDMDNGQGNGGIHSYYGSLYGTYLIERWYLEAITSYSNHSYDNTRQITVGSISEAAQSDHSGNAFSLLVGGGHVFPYKQWAFQPFGSLLYTYLAENSFEESGADGLDMKVDSRETSSLISELGLRVAGDVRMANGSLIPEVSAAWEYDFGIDDRNITASLTSEPNEPFTVAGQGLARNSAVLRAGISYIGKGGVTTSLKYSADLGSDHDSQALSGQVSIPF